MHNAADVTYAYDGTFDGLMCCVAESYERHEIPLRIVGPAEREGCLFGLRDIPSDRAKAERVIRSIPIKISREAYDFIRYAFLAYQADKEMAILLFLRKAYRVGSPIMRMLADDTVAVLNKAVRHLMNESHLLKGFIRFSEMNGVLVSKIEPKNIVLPLLSAHFCARYPKERFVIYDEHHHMALLYAPYRSAIVPMAELILPEPDEAESNYRRLWQVFYDAIEIEGRHNPQCRMNMMPKRYWEYMTEFNRSAEFIRQVEPAAAWKLLK